MEKERGITIINKDKSTVNGVLDSVIWRCKEDVYNERGNKVFTKGLDYTTVDIYGKSAYLIDDNGEETRASKLFFTSI